MYFKDKARLQIYKGINDRGDVEFEDETEVLCRFDYEQKETIDSKGNTILSSAAMFCDTFIPPLSVVYDECGNRFTVKSCKVIKRLSGNIDHYEAVI